MNHKDFLNIPGAQNEEMSGSQLKIGYWIADHRAGLRKLGIGLFIAFDVILGVYNIYSWTTYFLIGYFEDQKNAVELVNSAGALNKFTVARAAEPLVIEGSSAYESATGRFDAVAMVKNPNAEWYVSFDYEFDVGNGLTQKLQGFLLPGDEKPIGAFNLNGSFGASEPELKMSNIHWRHISKHENAHVTEWIGERTRFEIKTVSIVPGSSLGLPEGRLDFDLFNQSYFDYRDPEFFVGVWNGLSLLRVYKIHAPELKAGEIRHIQIAVPSFVPTNASLKLYPHIDFFDNSVYLK